MSDSDGDSHSFLDDIPDSGIYFGLAAIFVAVGGPAIVASAPIWVIGGAIILVLMLLSD